MYKNSMPVKGFWLKQLIKFRDLEITKNELMNTEGFEKFGNYEIQIEKKHLIYVLNRYINGSVDEFNLIDWVNFVWFSGWYYCENDDDNELIATIMYELEELDEQMEPLSKEKALEYIKLLSEQP